MGQVYGSTKLLLSSYTAPRNLCLYISSLVLLANVITATACEYKLLSLKEFVLT